MCTVTFLLVITILLGKICDASLQSQFQQPLQQLQQPLQQLLSQIDNGGTALSSPSGANSVEPHHLAIQSITQALRTFGRNPQQILNSINRTEMSNLLRGLDRKAAAILAEKISPKNNQFLKRKEEFKIDVQPFGLIVERNESSTIRKQQPHCICPIEGYLGCCRANVTRELQKWLTAPDRSLSAVQGLENGTISPAELVSLPPYILGRLSDEVLSKLDNLNAVGTMRAHVNDLHVISRVLLSIREPVFNDLIEFITSKDSTIQLSAPIMKMIVAATRVQWGEYDEWNDVKITSITPWLSQVPCAAFYTISPSAALKLINTDSSTVGVGDKVFDLCTQTALFNRVFESSAWSDVDAQSMMKVMSGAPRQFLSALPIEALEQISLLSLFANVPLTRRQIEALWQPLMNTKLTSAMINTMQPNLLRFAPVSALKNNVGLMEIQDQNVKNSLLQTFCKQDPPAPMRSLWQVYSWYAPTIPMIQWTIQDIGNVGCLLRLETPSTLATLNSTTLKDDTNVVVKIGQGEYDRAQATVLYARTVSAFMSHGQRVDNPEDVEDNIIFGQPSALLAGIPPSLLMKRLTSENAKQPDILYNLVAADNTRLGLTTAQGMIIVDRLIVAKDDTLNISPTTLRLLASSSTLMSHLTTSLLPEHPPNEILTSRSPKLSWPQRRVWLESLLTNEASNLTSGDGSFIHILETHFPGGNGLFGMAPMTTFIKGIDCRLIKNIKDEEILPLLAYIDSNGIQLDAAVARFLKASLIAHLTTFTPSPTQPYALASQLTSTLLAVVPADVLRQFSDQDIRLLGDDACLVLVDKTTKFDSALHFIQEVQPRSRREAFVRAALSCVLRNGTSSIGAKHAARLKYTMSALPSNAYGAIADEHAYNFIDYMKGSCYTNRQSNALTSKIQSVFGNNVSTWTSDDVSAIGCLLFELNSTVTVNIQTASVRDRVTELGACWDRRVSLINDIWSQCERELSLSDWRQMTQRVSLFAEKLIDVAKLNAPQTDGTTPTTKCAWAMSTGGLLPFATTGTILSMPQTEFVVCLPYMGQFTWEVQKRDAIMAQYSTWYPIPTTEMIGSFGWFLFRGFGFGKYFFNT